MTKLTSKELLKKQAQEIDFDDVTRVLVDDFIDYMLDDKDCSKIVESLKHKDTVIEEILTSGAHINSIRGLNRENRYYRYIRTKSSAFIYYVDKCKSRMHKEEPYEEWKTVEDRDNYEKQWFNLFQLFPTKFEQIIDKKRYHKAFVMKLSNGKKYKFMESTLYRMWSRLLINPLDPVETCETYHKRINETLQIYVKKSPKAKELFKYLEKAYDGPYGLGEGHKIGAFIITLMSCYTDDKRQQMINVLKKGKLSSQDMVKIAMQIRDGKR